MRAALALPAFRRLLGAYTVSQLGDWAAEVALAVLIYNLTASPEAVAVTWLVHRCLFALAAPLLVARLERHRPQRLLPALALAQAAIFAALAVSARSFGLPAILVLVAAEALIAPVSRALIRSTIASITRPAGLLVEGNAAVNVAFTTNAMLAAAVGGVLTATLGAPAALAFNALTFLAVAALLGGAPMPHTTATATGAQSQSATAALKAAVERKARASVPPTAPVFLGMAATMTVPMVAWMRYRGHRWQPTLEMAASMIIPTLVAIALLAADVLGFGAPMGLEHVAMLLGMLLAMLLRTDEYTSHAHHAHDVVAA